jgi:hypothetical protein
MQIEILEIGETDSQGVCVVIGNGEDAGQSFGFSVNYDEKSGKLVGKMTVSPKRFYVGQLIRKVIVPLIKERLTS